MIVADIYKGAALAAHFSQNEERQVVFSYAEDYDGPQIADSLPRNADSLVYPPGQIPPFFAGLLPEGYRLTRLAQQKKISLSNEIALLTEIGHDTPGDVQVVHHGHKPGPAAPLIDADFSTLIFSDLLERSDSKAIPGVQEKLSALMISLPTRVRKREQPCDREGIVKLSPRTYPHLVENEFAHMKAARRLGLAVAVVEEVSDSVGEKGLFVERFDRVCVDGTVKRIAFEDASQLLGLMPADKYDITTEEVISALASGVAAPLVTTQKAFTHFLFAWATGNGDLHAKNIGLLGSSAARELAPMYDLPCTLIYGDDEMALAIGGRKKRLGHQDWQGLASEVGIPKRALAGIAARVLNAARAVEWESLPFHGSVLNGCQRELRSRHYILEQLATAAH